MQVVLLCNKAAQHSGASNTSCDAHGSLRQEFLQAQRAGSALLHNNWGPGGETRRLGLGSSEGSFIPMSGAQLGRMEDQECRPEHRDVATPCGLPASQPGSHTCSVVTGEAGVGEPANTGVTAPFITPP